MLLQSFDGQSLLNLIKQLVALDKHWIPKEPGYSMYLRPTLSQSVRSASLPPLLTHCTPVGTQKTIGVSPPTEALLFVICSPVGPFYSQGFKPVALYGTTEFIRAAPGGAT